MSFFGLDRSEIFEQLTGNRYKFRYVAVLNLANHTLNGSVTGYLVVFGQQLSKAKDRNA